MKKNWIVTYTWNDPETGEDPHEATATCTCKTEKEAIILAGKMLREHGVPLPATGAKVMAKEASDTELQAIEELAKEVGQMNHDPSEYGGDVAQMVATRLVEAMGPWLDALGEGHDDAIARGVSSWYAITLAQLDVDHARVLVVTHDLAIDGAMLYKAGLPLTDIALMQRNTEKC